MRAQKPLVIAALLALTSGTAFALTSAGQRAVRNVTMILDNVQVDEKLVRGPIDERDRQSASNLLRDMDYALNRADGDLSRLDPEDAGDAQVKALVKRAAELKAKRDKLDKNLNASQESGQALDAQYRAFREDAKPFGKALSLFPDSSGSNQRMVNITAEQLVEGIKLLGQLDQICKSKYAGIQFNDRLAFQLAINPITVCETAAKRQELAAAMVKAMVQADMERWTKMIDEARTDLTKNEGFLSSAGGVVGDLIHNKEKGKAAFLERHKPFFLATGVPIPPDLTAPFDKAVDALWAEVDRLAPTWSFPAKTYKDGKTEGGAKKAMSEFVKGAKVLKTAALYADWSIDKNNVGIPTEKYRTGGILFKTSASKWCQYRTFTAHLEYAGGGRYQSKPSYTFGAIRYQKCD